LVQVTKCKQIIAIMNPMSLRCLYQNHFMSWRGPSNQRILVDKKRKQQSHNDDRLTRSRI